MPGDPDPLYVRARRALLDALEALRPHRDAIVLVGAQAIYVHTMDADLAVAEYTTDADLVLQPGALADEPLLDEALSSHGFTPREHPGGWLSADGIYLDLMVPEALAGAGRRGARLGRHGKRAARRARGLEAALVDRDECTIRALDPADPRTATISVAGPAALLVAKTHKIAERVGAQDRVRDKDALDVLRLLRAVPTDALVERLAMLLSSHLASAVTSDARSHLLTLFGDRDAEGVAMMVRAAGDPADAETLAASLIALVQDLLAAWEESQ